MSGTAYEPGVAAGEASDTPAGASPLLALEEKARRLLKRCRYGEAGRCFKQVLSDLELVVEANPATTNSGSSSQMSREIGALEGLAICLSRQLE